MNDSYTIWKFLLTSLVFLFKNLSSWQILNTLLKKRFLIVLSFMIHKKTFIQTKF